MLTFLNISKKSSALEHRSTRPAEKFRNFSTTPNKNADDSAALATFTDAVVTGYSRSGRWSTNERTALQPVWMVGKSASNLCARPRRKSGNCTQTGDALPFMGMRISRPATGRECDACETTGERVKNAESRIQSRPIFRVLS